MKRFLASLIRSILVVAVFSVLLSAAMLVPVKEEETVDPEVTLSADADFLKEDIYLDGSIKYNWKLASPVGITGDTVYIPLDISGFEGIKESAEEEPEKGGARPVGHAEGNSIVLDAYDLSEDGEAPEEEPSEPEDPAEARAERFGGIKISLEDGETRHEFSGFSGTRGFKGLKGVFLSGNDDILLCDDGTYYGSLDFVKNYLGVDCVYSPGAGLYLSTDPAVPAQLYADADTNPSYEKGAIAYIMAIKRNLSEETAV